MEVTLEEKLRVIDDKMKEYELSPELSERVKAHMLKALELSQEKLAVLGPCPQTVPEREAWERNKQEMEESLTIQLESERLIEGLVDPWAMYLSRENLKTLRSRVASGQAGDVPLPQTLQEIGAWINLHVGPPIPGAGQITPGPNSPDQMGEPNQVQTTSPPMTMQMGADLLGQTGQQLKLCRRCGLQKPVSEFYRSKANADGYDGRCKACDAVQCSERRKKKPRIDVPTVQTKTCHKCGEEKGSNEFYRNRTNIDGLYNDCKACHTRDAVARRERMPPVEDRLAVSKQCKQCNEQKNHSDFYRNKVMSDGLYSICKKCYLAKAATRGTERQVVHVKFCRRCNQEHPASEFYNSKMTIDGLQSYCKGCYAVTAAQRRSDVAAQKKRDAEGVGMLPDGTMSGGHGTPPDIVAAMETDTGLAEREAAEDAKVNMDASAGMQYPPQVEQMVAHYPPQIEQNAHYPPQVDQMAAHQVQTLEGSAGFPAQADPEVKYEPVPQQFTDQPEV